MNKGTIGISFLLMCVVMAPAAVFAAEVDVYAEAAYTESDLHVYIYQTVS